jgi:hypothetical protein
MEVLLLLVMGAVNIACFMVGAKVGQTVVNGEEVKLLPVKPAETVQVHQAQSEAEMDKKTRLETIMRNIDNYDGTDQGQEDVPWR